jgi:hypothetical protein
MSIRGKGGTNVFHHFRNKLASRSSLLFCFCLSVTNDTVGLLVLGLFGFKCNVMMKYWEDGRVHFYKIYEDTPC